MEEEEYEYNDSKNLKKEKKDINSNNDSVTEYTYDSYGRIKNNEIFLIHI